MYPDLSIQRQLHSQASKDQPEGQTTLLQQSYQQVHLTLTHALNQSSFLLKLYPPPSPLLNQKPALSHKLHPGFTSSNSIQEQKTTLLAGIMLSIFLVYLRYTSL